MNRPRAQRVRKYSTACYDVCSRQLLHELFQRVCQYSGCFHFSQGSSGHAKVQQHSAGLSGQAKWTEDCSRIQPEPSAPCSAGGPWEEKYPFKKRLAKIILQQLYQSEPRVVPSNLNLTIFVSLCSATYAANAVETSISSVSTRLAAVAKFPPTSANDPSTT